MVTSPPSSPPGNVILIVCDTLRADRLGLYGYDRPTSPFLDHLAAQSIVYENAYSHYSYTWPTISNLFTGLPYSLLVKERGFTRPQQGGAGTGGGLTRRFPSLASKLLRRGVTSAGVSANPYVNSRLGFGRGFAGFHDVYSWDPQFWEHLHKYTGEEVNAVALPLVERLRASGGPWLLYLHYFDTHVPYQAPAGDRARFVDPQYHREGRFVDGYLRGRDGTVLKYLTDDVAGWIGSEDVRHLSDQYDAEIRHLDRALAQLFFALRDRGVLEDTTLVITADHGEAFMERRFWGHGFLSREEEERVPMIVVPAERLRRPAERVRAMTVTTTDVHYSVLAHFGAGAVNTSSPWWGAALLDSRELHPLGYTEGAYDAVILRDGRHSLYLYQALSGSDVPLPAANGEMLFDRSVDPGEIRDLFVSEPPKAAAIRRRLLDSLAQRGIRELPTSWGDPFDEADRETRKQLEALGYN